MIIHTKQPTNPNKNEQLQKMDSLSKRLELMISIYLDDLQASSKAELDKFVHHRVQGIVRKYAALREASDALHPKSMH